MVSGFWFLVSGFWFLVYGFWFMVSGSWFMVYGFWFVVRTSKGIKDSRGRGFEGSSEKPSLSPDP
jgi:hypothetical protein